MSHKIMEARPNSKTGMIRDLALRGLTKLQAFTSLRHLVDTQTPPMVFSANVGGRRIAKPLHEQLQMLRDAIGRIYAALGRSTSTDFDSPEIEIDPTTFLGTVS